VLVAATEDQQIQAVTMFLPVDVSTDIDDDFFLLLPLVCCLLLLILVTAFERRQEKDSEGDTDDVGR
jgi:hypothetical protein